MQWCECVQSPQRERSMCVEHRNIWSTEADAESMQFCATLAATGGGGCIPLVLILQYSMKGQRVAEFSTDECCYVSSVQPT